MPNLQQGSLPELLLLPRMPRPHFDVKQKDCVVFSKYAGTEIKIDGIEHLFMKAVDILVVVG
jgi:co-chaperonin GroES (HSP10)